MINLIAFNKKIHFRYVVQLVKCLLIAMLFYSSSRLLFYTMNVASGDHDTQSILFSFLHGLRFDLSVLMKINLILIVSSIILGFFGKSNKRMNILITLFCVLNLPFIICNFFDIAYYPFTGRRSGVEVFDSFADFVHQLPQIVIQYWLAIIGSIPPLLLFVWLCFKQKTGDLQVSLWKGIGWIFCIIALSLLSMRGGVQKKPLSPIHAYQWPNIKLASLTLNTPTVLLGGKKSNLQRYNWYSSYEKSCELLDINRKQSFVSKAKKTQNVVIFILESFHSETLKPLPEYGVAAPFLSQLSKQGLFFENAFANGRCSIDVMPSVLVGMPHLLTQAFIRSSYCNNSYTSLPEILSHYGYKTDFYHGAPNGSFYLDIFANRIGIDSYHGFNEFKNKFPELSKNQSTWGVFDEDFLQYMVDDLSHKQQPFFATVFTLSSHNPYEIPKKHQSRFNEKDYPHPFYRSVSYTDYSIEQFFNVARKMDWYEDTLFIFTADHTGPYSTRYENNNDLGNYHIPIFLYHPKGLIPNKVSSMVVQQADIPATVLDYLGKLDHESNNLLPYGQSMFDDSRKGYALLAPSEQECILVSNDRVTRYNKSTSEMATSALLGPIFNARGLFESDQALEDKLKAFLQLYNNGLIENNMNPLNNGYSRKSGLPGHN